MKNKEGVGNRNADPKPMSESEEGVGVVRGVRRRSAGGDRVDTESTEGGAREVRGRCEVGTEERREGCGLTYAGACGRSHVHRNELDAGGQRIVQLCKVLSIGPGSIA